MPDPRNTYAATKLNGEHLAASWARETGGRVAAMRFHNVYGPGMPRNTPYAGVAALFRSALERGEAPRVFEDGGQRRDFVHVRDIATAVTTAAEALTFEHRPQFAAYNVGSGTVRTIGDLATELARAYGGRWVATRDELTDRHAIAQAVWAWGDKKRKFTREQIDIALDRLEELDWVASAA